MTVDPDAVPDLSRTRVQLLLRTSGPGALEPALVLLAEAAAEGLDPSVAVAVLEQIPDDPFPANNPGGRPFAAVLDLDGPAGSLAVDRAEAALADGLAPVLALVDPEASTAVVGAPQAVIPGPRCALRYLYAMRRRDDLSHDAYLDHYFHHHSSFSFHLHGIRAYTQVHVDPEASAELAQRLGLGVEPLDSVTELTFDTVEGFFAGVTPQAAAAGEDELRFVDRERSVSFCSTDRTVRAPA